MQNTNAFSVNGILTDIHDGLVMKNHVLFKSKTAMINIILYQDSFELVNPLGSAKGKHKTLSVYLSLGNLYPHNRSTVDQMQLVMLCLELDFKLFG